MSNRVSILKWRTVLLFVAAALVLSILSSIDKVGAKRPIAMLTPPSPPAGSISYDFDGDGKADVGRWHGSNTEFRVKLSTGGSDAVFTLGSTVAIATPGDFDGNGVTDACVFASGTWTYKTSPSASPQTISLGASGDVPFVGKFDTDSKTDAVVFTPSTRVWTIRSSKTGSTSTQTFGNSGDIPTVGNFDGDSLTDIAVFRPANGTWYIQLSGGGTSSPQFGASGDIPVQGDFDADGKSDPTVYRPSTGEWWVLRSSTGYSTYYAVTWGSYGDQPVPADYDGDGITDIAVWRPTTGVWFIIKSSSPQYMYKTVGVAGDEAIESAYTRQIGGVVGGDIIGPLRLKPTNATGGTNLYSQNFGWSTSLVSLPGRAGLDLNLGISANSLVWIKYGSTMYYDPDHGNVGPGFRFGFPVIEPVYYDSTKGKWTYIMVTPSGARAEFRQIGAGSTYETADLTYSQIVTSGATNPNDPVEFITITVKTADGTQMFYDWKAGAFRCNKILDRNGNYITVTHDTDTGALTGMTDTLGRVVSVTYVNYHSTYYPSTITQTWKSSNGSGSDTTHTWASFSYVDKTVATNFGSGITYVAGPANNSAVRVLDKITYADGSANAFEYNGYLQLTKVSTIAPDTTHVLNYVTTNLAATPSPTPLPDCPRFTETRTYAQDFNGGNEVVTTNSLTTGASYSLPDGHSGAATKITTGMTDHPNGLYTNVYVASSGWKEGLPLATEDCVSGCSGTDRKRWTWNDWTQDTVSGMLFGYPMNPRLIETRVGDDTNTKKTTITYFLDYDDDGGAAAHYGQVDEVTVYDGSTPKKTEKSTYVTDSNYISRRMLGLPLSTMLFEGDSGGTLMARTDYAYDVGGYGGSGQSVTPVQHDNVGYSSMFSIRGNPTGITRCDATVSSVSTCQGGITSSIKYNTAGSPISQTDPRGRVTSISYTDNWYDNTSRTTYAYPTTLTDPGGFSSTIKYRFDIGANVLAESPIPNGADHGKKTSRTYEDDTGRISRETIENSFTGFNTAHTRYDYDDNGTEITSYSTIIDEEVATLIKTDGTGRVTKTRTENPGAPSGDYTGQLVEYDILGRVVRQSAPTEIDGSWHPTGDDYRGNDIWLWNTRTYDWKGRVLRLIPSDSSGNDGKDTVFSYAGCGCAGGQVTTISGPESDAIDMGGSTIVTGKRKTQKIIEDILGRVVTKELRSLDGTYLYSTTTTEYNGRDQPTSITEHAVAGPSPTPPDQTTTMGYDGYGRLTSLHKPEWNGNTTTTYNPDDTLNTVTDPRGASATYSYETANGSFSRPLVTGIAYATPTPPTNVAATAAVAFEYDAAGNRQQMTDGSGTTLYTYDELSRLKTESKNFTGTFTYEPPGGVYTLTYDYHLNGSLKSIEDPFEHVTTYSADKIGRVTNIGTVADADLYVANILHRSFGVVKSMSLGTTASTGVTMTYDDALRPLTYEAENSTTGANVYIQKASYTYLADGALKEINNLRDTSHNFDQKNEYDFAGRLRKNDVGPLTGSGSHPLMQTMSYDAFSNLTSRTNDMWGTPNGFSDSFTATYTNNLQVSGPATVWYDRAGNVIYSSSPGGGELPGGRSYTDVKNWTFDAAGRNTYWDEHGPWFNQTRSENIGYDGDGQVIRHDDAENNLTWYYVNSSVTGERITDLYQGSWVQTHIYLGDTKIADISGDETFFTATDPVGGSTQQVDPDGTALNVPGMREERAGFGMIPSLTPPPNFPQPISHRPFIGDSFSGCNMDGFATSLQVCNDAIAGGWAAQCPENNCNPRAIWYKDENGKTRSFLTTPAMWRDDDLGPHGYFWPGTSVFGTDAKWGTFDAQDAGWNEIFDRAAAGDTDLHLEDFALFFQETGDPKKRYRAPRRQRPPKATLSRASAGVDLDREILGLRLIGFLAQVDGPCADALKALKLSSKDIINAFDAAKFKPDRQAAGHANSDLYVGGQIRTLNGIDDFVASLDTSWLLHELAHMASKKGDQEMFRTLVDNLNIALVMDSVPGKGRNKNVFRQLPNYSKSLSKFFNDNCK